MKRNLSLCFVFLLMLVFMSACKKAAPKPETPVSSPPEVEPLASQVPLEQENSMPVNSPDITDETKSEIPDENPIDENGNLALPADNSSNLKDDEAIVLEQIVSLAKSVDTYQKSVDSLKKIGIDMEILTKDNKLVFSYHVTNIALGDTAEESIKETARNTADAQLIAMQPTANALLAQMKLLGIENPVILCEFFDKNDELFFEKEILPQ